MNQIKTFLFLTIFLSNFVGLFANTIKLINVRKMYDITEETLTSENDREAKDFCHKLDSNNPDDRSYYISQKGLSYLYSNLDNEQETKKTSNDAGVDTYTAAFTIEIKFGFDTSEINQAYLKDIEVLYATYKQHEEAYVEISGHTDSKGSESHNKALSQLRADAVKKYLVNKGIPKDRIITKAIGEKQPISPNINPDGSDNPEGRSNNRRTDIKIVNY